MSAMGPEGSGHWLLCLTFLFHKVGRRPLAFPDLGCDHVTLGMKVPEKGHAHVITPFSVLERLCVVTCVLFMMYFSLPTPVLFCVAFLFFQFSELSSITQSVGGLVIGLPEVAWPGLVHTGGPCCESPESPAPALRGCVLPTRATLLVSRMDFIPASPASPQHPSLRLTNLPAGPSHCLLP